MGKFRNRTRKHHNRKFNSSLDKSSNSSGSRSPEFGGVSSPATDLHNIEATMLPDRLNESDGGGGGDATSVLERPSDIRSLNPISLRVSGRQTPQVTRSIDPNLFNSVLNDPDIFPLISGTGVEYIDTAPLIADMRNVLLVTEGGTLFFNWHEPGIYELHNNFLPKYRGRWALEAARAALRWMFLKTDCMTIVTRVPKFNRAAYWSARAMGAVLDFERKNIWFRRDGSKADVSYWSLRFDEWLKQTDFKPAGKMFHVKLRSEMELLGAPSDNSEMEDCYLQRIGCFAEIMANEIQVEKAIILYNRWARFAGYGLIDLISAPMPLLVDYGGILIQFQGEDFKVLKCPLPL